MAFYSVSLACVCREIQLSFGPIQLVEKLASNSALLLRYKLKMNN